MTLAFRSTQVSAPTTPPSLSVGSTGHFIRHRRVNLDGGVSLWSEASECSAAPVTITPESYSDPTQLLRDEFLYSADDSTYYIIPRSGTLTGAQTVSAFSSGSWAIATNEDSQNSALTNLNFGTFTSSNSPFKRFYLVNDGLSVGSLTFNFTDAITTEVATVFSGLIQVEIEGVFSQYSQAPSTVYNDLFIWQSPPNNLNTLGLVFPSNAFVQIKVTLLNFPTGGLIENTISLSMQVQENVRVFPLSYDSGWALNSFLYDPAKGFDFPFIEVSNAGLTVTIKPFLVNINGVLVGRFTDTVFTVPSVGDYEVTLTTSGVLQIWDPVTETIPSNVIYFCYVTTIATGTFIDYAESYLPPRPNSYGYAPNADSVTGRIVEFDGGTGDVIYATSLDTVIGVTLGSSKGYATGGVAMVATKDVTIVKGDFLTIGTNGFADQSATGFLVALKDYYFGFVLCEFRYLSASGETWGGIAGTLSDQTDLQSALDAKEPTITSGSTSQYYRGDKTFQTLNKTAVGLGNVDNTSDANKPISTATQTALNAKQDTLVSGTNIKTINSTSLLGSGDIVISGGSSAWGGITGTLSAQTDLQSALNGKQASNADLTAIAALISTGILRRTGTNTWTLDPYQNPTTNNIVATSGTIAVDWARKNHTVTVNGSTTFTQTLSGFNEVNIRLTWTSGAITWTGVTWTDGVFPNVAGKSYDVTLFSYDGSEIIGSFAQIGA